MSRLSPDSLPLSYSKIPVWSEFRLYSGQRLGVINGLKHSVAEGNIEPALLTRSTGLPRESALL